MLEIKLVLPEHWPVLKSVRLRALADAPEAFGTTWAEALAYPEGEWQARARRFTETPPATGYIAYWNGAPCGMACAYPSEGTPQAAGLTSFWVAPEARGQGIGDTLVAFIADWAAAAGFAMLEADVVEDNHRAIAFYKRMWFQATGQSEPFRGDPSKQIVRLAKTLQQ